MTQQEHLQLIRAKCVELLEIAEKRTPGLWTQDYIYIDTDDMNDGIKAAGNGNNATFIASCAGAAEAGWKATIAAIDDSMWQPAPEGYCHPDNPWGVENTALIRQIIASWPIELLQQK